MYTTCKSTNKKSKKTHIILIGSRVLFVVSEAPETFVVSSTTFHKQRQKKRMAQVSGDVENYYREVRNDKSNSDYVLLGYEGNNIVVQSSGSGTNWVDELKDNEAQFVFFRVQTGDKESKRTKFVFLTWVGEQVSVLKKAKISIHKGDVKKVIRDFACEFHCTERADLDVDKIRATVIKAGGANYNGQDS